MATLKQIAEEAGVSISIVSRILSPNPEPSGRFSPDTQKRVEEAARKLGYRPNRYAEFLKRGQVPAIGVFMPAYSNRLIADLVMGLAEGAAAAAFPLSLHFALTLDHYREFLRANGNHCGIITYPGFHKDKETKKLIGKFQDGGGKVLLLNTDIQLEGVPVVAMDNRHGGNLAAERLRDHSCGEYLLMGSFPGRDEGFEETLRHYDIEEIRRLPENEWENYLPRMVERATAERPLGIFAVNDLLALRIMRFLHSQKVAIGREVMVIGYDDLAATAECYPPLTTIHQPFREEGKIAIEKMVNVIYGQEEDSVFLEPTLVVRKSG